MKRTKLTPEEKMEQLGSDIKRRIEMLATYRRFLYAEPDDDELKEAIQIKRKILKNDFKELNALMDEMLGKERAE